MWQTVLVVFLLAGVMIYVIRHYVSIFRAEASICSGCSGCNGIQPAQGKKRCQ